VSTDCSLNVTNLAHSGGLIMSIALVTGSPEAAQEVES
jgi:hypothetical protein